MTGPGVPVEPAPSGPGELVDPVQGLAEAPCQFRVGAGRDVRDGHLQGHLRAGAPPGHREGAPVALVVGAVPGKAARGGVGDESAAGVVAVAVRLTPELDTALAGGLAGYRCGDPVGYPARVRNQAPDSLRRGAHVSRLLELRHSASLTVPQAIILRQAGQQQAGPRPDGPPAESHPA